MECYDIVLCNCTKQFGNAQREHMGINYLAAVLKEKNYSVLVIDSLLQELTVNDIINQLSSINFKYIGISFLSYGYIEAKELSYYLKQNINCKIIIGGHFVSFNLDKIIEDEFSFDYAIVGEAEKSLPQILDKIKRGIDVPKISFGKPCGDLNELPFPTREYLNVILEKDIPISISSSRGCYYNCSFCSVNKFYSKFSKCKWRYRDIINVIEEMKYLYDIYKIKKFDFIDDNFSGSTIVGKTRFMNFASEIIRVFGEDQLEISFDLRLEDVEEKSLMLWKRAGLKNILIGVESLNANDQSIYNKRINKDKIEKTISILKKHNINFKLGLIMWNPESTIESVLETISFLKKIGYVETHPLIKLNIYNGTDLYDRYKNIIFGTFYDLKWNFYDDELNNIYNDLFKCILRSQKQMLYISLEKQFKIHILNTNLIHKVLSRAKEKQTYHDILDIYNRRLIKMGLNDEKTRENI